MAKRVALQFIIILVLIQAGLLITPTPVCADVITYRGFDSVNIKDGLSDNIVSAIGQDDQGFMWFGTQKGLNRFDGYDIKDYPLEGCSTLNPSQRINGILVSRDNRVWFSTSELGILNLDPGTGNFTELGFLRADSTSTDDWGLLDFSEGSDGAIWAVADNGEVARIETSSNDATNSWTWYREFSMTEVPPFCIWSSSTGTTWVGNLKGEVSVLDNQGQVINTLKLPRWDESRYPKVLKIFESSDGAFWFCTNIGLYRLKPQSEVFELLQPRPTRKLTNFNLITHMSEDSSGILWLGSYVGLYRLDPETDQFELQAHDQTDPGSPPPGPITHTYCGTSGMVWASCWFSGVIKYNPKAVSFRIENYNRMDPRGLAGNAVNSLLEEPNGTLWVGTGHPFPGGSKGVLHRRRPNTAGFDRWEFPTPRVTVVNSIFRDENEQLWIGTNFGLWHFVEGSAEALVRADNIPETESLEIYILNGDSDGNLWVGTSGSGLFVLNLETGDSRHFQNDSDDDTSLSAKTVLAISIKDQENIWIGTDGGGLLLYDRANLSFKRFLQQDPSTVNISSIIPRPDGGLWLGSYGGLIDFHPDRGIRKKFNIASGLPGEVVTQQIVDHSGNLWFTVGTGIALLNPEADQFKVFSEEDGIGDFGTSFAAIKKQNGNLLFGGTGGLLEFDPAQFVSVEFSPPVVFSEITVNGQPVRENLVGEMPNSQATTRLLDLTHTQNDISLTFAALDYSSSFGALYRYRMDGVDEQWSEPNKVRRTKYTNLDPGSYIFRVLASNGQGQWNPHEALIKFVIHKPWWETWWARTGYFVLIMVVLFLTQRQVTARQKIRRALALNKTNALHTAEMSELKAKFLVNVAHEFRGPLTLIKSLAQQKEEAETESNSRTRSMLERNTSRLEFLTDQLSALANLETGGIKIKLNYGSTINLLRELAMMYRSICKKRGIRFIFHAPEDKGEGWVDFSLLQKIVTNLMVYSIKSTDYRGIVDVQITLSPKTDSSADNHTDYSTNSHVKNGSCYWLEIKVTNSATGNLPGDPEKAFDRFYTSSPSDKQKFGDSGIGLTLVKEFTLLLGGSVSAQTAKEGSTCFKVILPIIDSDPPAQQVKPEITNGALSAETLAIVKGTLSVADQITTDKPSNFVDGNPTPDFMGLKTILIIAQDADMRSFLRSKLGSEFNIVEAIDGASGLEMVISDLPDMVLCDEQIGETTSIELCQQTKQRWRTQAIPVMIFVAGEDDGTRLAAYEAAADDCVAKPFNFIEVRQRIYNLINQRSRIATKHGESPESGNTSPPVDLPGSEDDFMTALNLVIEKNLEDPEFKVENLASELFMSRRTLQRKLLELTGQTGSNYLRNKRLQRAAKLLSQGYSNVMDVSLAVGYKNPSNFSRAFREYFGASPSEYRKAQL